MWSPVCSNLPAEYAAPLRFAYITGWRFHSEVLALTADRGDPDRGTVRLDAGMTKNGKPRVFVLMKELRRALEEQLASIDRLKEQEKIVPLRVPPC